MKSLPFVVFLCILFTALCSSVCSYHAAERLIHQDVSQALAKTLACQSGNVVTADTIRCYRSHITIAEVRDTASISIRVARKGNLEIPKLTAEANCSFPVIFMLSNQKPSALLFCLGLLWLICSSLYLRRNHPQLFNSSHVYGGLILHDQQILTINGTPVHLTPMQFDLLEMFISSETHTLTKQEICDKLWPKKPDANDTLYTLIRRTRPILEAHSSLRFESNRGKSYSLVIK